MNSMILQRNQRGVALVVGLILLIVVTLVAISGIKSTNIQQSMAAGMQQNMMVYQTADTMIQQVLNEIDAATPSDVDGDGAPGPHLLVHAINNHDATLVPPQPAYEMELAIDPKQAEGKPTAVAEVSFQGVSNSVPGFSFGTYVGYMFQADSTADFAVENTQANNLVGVMRVAPSGAP